jgi:ribosomal protein S18 acetylase RimI-like enzyme
METLGVWVRPAELDVPEDAEAVVSLLDAYAADPMGAGAPLADEVRRDLVPALSGVPTRLILLALLATEPVGIAVCFEGFSTFSARPLLNIHDLAVLPAHRGRGVGRALLAAVEEEARRRGCCKLTLEVREDNPVAARLYARLGFGPGRAEGTPVPHRFLERRLSD